MRCDFCSYAGPDTKWSVFESSNMVEFRMLCGACRSRNTSRFGWNVVEHNHRDDGRLHSACHACDLAQDLTHCAGDGDQTTKTDMDRFAYELTFHATSRGSKGMGEPILLEEV